MASSTFNVEKLSYLGGNYQQWRHATVLQSMKVSAECSKVLAMEAYPAFFGTPSMPGLVAIASSSSSSSSAAYASSLSASSSKGKKASAPGGVAAASVEEGML